MDGQNKTQSGRPTLYKPEYAEMAHNYCLLGATNDELAGFFNVSPSTVDNWLSVHSEFATAVGNGRAAADASIARKLFQRALGYDYDTRKIFMYRGTAVEVPCTMHMPADVGACIFWLRNRRRHQWLERARPDPDDSGLTVLEIEEAAERARRMREQAHEQ